MISSSNTEYAFWKLKILYSRSKKKKKHRWFASCWGTYKSNSHTWKRRGLRGWDRKREGGDSRSRNTDPRLRRNDGRSPASRVRCLPPRSHTRRKGKRIACRRPWYLRKRTLRFSHDQIPQAPRRDTSSVEEKHTVPLYSRKLHIFVRLASTSCVTSLTILALTFWDIVVNHFCNLTFPSRVSVFRARS